jgi:hypothetical protein
MGCVHEWEGELRVSRVGGPGQEEPASASEGPSGVGTMTVTLRVQQPADSEADCRTVARRVQKMVSEPAIPRVPQPCNRPEPDRPECRAHAPRVLGGRARTCAHLRMMALAGMGGRAAPLSQRATAACRRASASQGATRNRWGETALISVADDPRGIQHAHASACTCAHTNGLG